LSFLPEVVGVRFRKAGKVYYFAPGRLAIEKNDMVVVETARGVELGQIVFGRRQICDKAIAPFLPLKEVKRLTVPEDIAHWQSLKAKAKEAFRICLEKIKQHQLEMKLLDAEYTFDSAKLIFQFTADGRVDFRNLVRDLAAVFRTRIELRQVGVRDEAKLIGGLGGCGRELCCCSFLGDFLPVSIKMARDQNISLNPTKISGVCGRLLCCLNYELDEYGAVAEAEQDLSVGALVESLAGRGRIVSLNLRRQLAKISLLNGGGISELALSDLVLIVEEEPKQVVAKADEDFEALP